MKQEQIYGLEGELEVLLVNPDHQNDQDQNNQKYLSQTTSFFTEIISLRSHIHIVV